MDHTTIFASCNLWLHVFIAAMNVMQSIALALIGARAVRKYREDKRRTLNRYR
jgi:hypothetical protein